MVTIEPDVLNIAVGFGTPTISTGATVSVPAVNIAVAFGAPIVYANKLTIGQVALEVVWKDAPPTVYLAQAALEIFWKDLALNCDSGSFTVTGQAASLLRTFYLACESGSFLVSGQRLEYPATEKTTFGLFAYWDDVLVSPQPGDPTTGIIFGMDSALTDRRYYSGAFSHGNDLAWADPRILQCPALSFGGQNDYNLLPQNQTTLEIADPDLTLDDDAMLGREIVLEHYARDTFATAGYRDRLRRLTYTVTGYQRDHITLTLTLEDLVDTLLEKEYPPRRYEQNAYAPDLLAVSVGRAIPYLIGQGIKIQCVLLANQSDSADVIRDNQFRDTSAWTTSSSPAWTIATGSAHKAAGSTLYLRQAVSITDDAFYVVQCDVTVLLGTLTCGLKNALAATTPWSTTGTVTAIIQPSSGNAVDLGLFFVPDDAFAGDLDNVTLYALTHRYTFGGVSEYSNTGGALTEPVVKTGSGSTVGRAYRVQFTHNTLSGDLTVAIGGQTWTLTASDNGQVTLDHVATTTDDLVVTLNAGWRGNLGQVQRTFWTRDGADLITNGGFATSASWTLGDESPWALSGGYATYTYGSSHTLTPVAGNVVVGALYRVEMDYAVTTGSLTLSLGGVWYPNTSGAGAGQSIQGSGSLSWTLTAATTAALQIVPSFDFSGSVTQVAVIGTSLYRYGVCEKPDATTVIVQTVYRQGAVVPSTEWVQETYSMGSYNLITLGFVREQVDFSGNHYTITCDAFRDDGANLRNVVQEIDRVLTWAGLAVNTTDRDKHRAVAAAWSSYVDWCYGWNGQATTIRAILDQLLLIMRGAIYRNDNNEFVYWIDDASILVDPTPEIYDEGLGDLVAVNRISAQTLPETITLGYRPRPDDPSTPQHILTRSLNGGLSGEIRYDLPMVYHFATADKLHSYLAERKRYGKTLSATLYQSDSDFGAVVNITCPLYSGARDWIITSLRSEADQLAITGLEYQAAVYQYTPGTEPEGGSQYQTDYSNTMPAAPTGLIITATGLDGEVGYASVTCYPPAVNWAKIFFVAENKVTKVLIRVEGLVDGPQYKASLSPLTLDQEYAIYAWAENSDDVAGFFTNPVRVTVVNTA